MKLNLTTATCCFLTASVSILAACDGEKPSAQVAAPKAEAHEHDHAHDSAADHAHASEHSPAAIGHGGAVIQLGSATIGAFDANATRDEGAIVAGKDAPIDVTITPSAGATVTVSAVRFWIGTQDAKGSVKAKADIEDPKSPNRWHTHAEIPNPIPTGAKIWVEIEDSKGAKSVGGFDLKN